MAEHEDYATGGIVTAPLRFNDDGCVLPLLTDEQVRGLAQKYMQNPGIREAMKAFQMTGGGVHPEPSEPVSGADRNGDGL